jgi:dTMP kinase
LPKLQQALDTVPPSQKLWMRLFLAQSYAEVTQLAQEEPLFLKVCEVLEMVSKNSKMQDRARMIWEGEFAVRNEKYLLEKERAEEKARLEKEAEQKVAAAQHEADQRVTEALREAQYEAQQRVAETQRDAEQRIVAAQHEAEQRVAVVRREADQKFQETQQALSKAVRTLSATGQTPDAIATLLNLSPERVIEILNTP